MRKLKKPVKIAIGTGVVLLLGASAAFGVKYYRNAQKVKSYNSTFESLVMEVDEAKLKIEYGDTFNQTDFIKSYVGDLSQDKEVDVNEVGEQTITYTLEKIDDYQQDVKREYVYTFEIEDTKAPIIELNEDKLSVIKGMDLDIAGNISKVYDEVDGDLEKADASENGSYYIEDNINYDEAGEYEVKVIAKDKHGLETEKTFSVDVIDHVDAEFPYYIRINRALNTVTVYAMDLDGEYSIPYKAMVCSTGDATPLGSYNTTANYRWCALIGNVYGQYATRIVDSILFHSVPYYSQSPDDLESEEYNKLGTAASLGCVRLCVRDTKWIYDNCPIGTTVEFYDDYDNPGPLGKPEPITIDLNSPNKGWDPTDPDPNNPW